MARRHRNAPSPYEVMTTVPTQESASGSDPVPAAGQSVSPDTVVADRHRDTAGSNDGRQTKNSPPIVLRVPHGMAALFLVGFFGLMVLTYWVGRTRGYRLALQEGPRESISLARVGPTEGGAALPGPSQTEPLITADQPVPPPDPVSVGEDPRTEGMNYIVLAHYPEQDARRLVAFLADEGVDAAAARPEGKKYFQVVALRSFAKEDLDSRSYLQYKQRLLRLGRKWKERGLGPNFSGIFPSRYQGHEMAQVITKKDIDHEY